MLIHRVKTANQKAAGIDEALSIAGVGSPFFFLDASTVNTGSSTWTDSAGGLVGTFENAGFSLLSEGDRQFVRLTNCRCVFPTSVLTSADTGVILIASVRPAAGNNSNRMLVSMPRTTSATYSWYVQFDTAQTVTNYTYHGSTNDTRTYGRGMPKAGSWGLLATGKYAYPAEDYIDGSAAYIRAVTAILSDSLNIAKAAFTLHSTSALPFLVGGGRASGGSGAGTMANTFLGDIEWLGLWKTPISAERMVLLREAMERPRIVRNAGYGFPPKKDVGRIVYVDADKVGVEYEGADAPVFAEANTYAPGDIVYKDGILHKILGPKTHSSGLYWTRNIVGGKATPFTDVTDAAYKLRNNDVLAISGTVMAQGTSVADLTLNTLPPTPYSSHIPARHVKVIPYSAETGELVTTGILPKALTLKNGVYSIRGFEFDYSYYDGGSVDPYVYAANSLYCENALVYAQDCVLADIKVDRACLHGHGLTLQGGVAKGYSDISGTFSSYSSYRIRLLGYGGYFDTGAVQILRGYGDIGFSRLASCGAVSSILSGKLSLANCATDTLLGHSSYSDPPEYAPLVRTETPGGAYVEWLGGSVELNQKITTGTPYGPPSNMLQSMSYVSIEAISSTKQTTGLGSTNRDIATEDTATYMPAAAAYLDRPPFSFVTRFPDIVYIDGTYVGMKPHDPGRTRNYIEFHADIVESGLRTFEIDFMVQSTTVTIFDDPKGFLSVAAFYYDTEGNYRIYRDIPVRTGLSVTWVSSYSLTEKVTENNWVSASPMGLSGSRVFSLPDVGAGRVRIRASIGGLESKTAINPIIKVT